MEWHERCYNAGTDIDCKNPAEVKITVEDVEGKFYKQVEKYCFKCATVMLPGLGHHTALFIQHRKENK